MQQELELTKNWLICAAPRRNPVSPRNKITNNLTRPHAFFTARLKIN
jgi:hypothetical protein